MSGASSATTSTFRPAGKAWLGADEASEALDKFRFYYSNEFVDFMGGEPTLHPAIIDIVSHAARIGLRPTVITHGMHLAKLERAEAYAQAGIHDFLVSVHGIGDTAAAIHGRGRNNSARQMQALDNLRTLGIPFRFNVTMIRDNVSQLPTIAELAAEKGARVVNFLAFNPYFEWARDIQISFQARHSEISQHLAQAIDTSAQSPPAPSGRDRPALSVRLLDELLGPLRKPTDHPAGRPARR